MVTKLRSYWKLIKSLQTGLLLLTGLAGYMSARCPVFNLTTILALGGSLFLAISGSTILNMWFDRDIDTVMKRTCTRPMPAGTVSPSEGLTLGLVLSGIGIGWALLLDPLYGAIVFAGLFFDVFVYTIWLKRRTAWSIVWGGISGGMPILAGRAFGLGEIDAAGLILSAAVLFWIPTHIMTFNMRYSEDYAAAGVPTFPSVYGNALTRKVIAGSSGMASLAMVTFVFLVGLSNQYANLIAALSIVLIFIALGSMLRPSNKVNFGLFKFASFYMLGSMLVIVFQGF
jgi:protoheme IX farnesyltransferase